MNDGKGTVSVGSGTLPTGACLYCGKICETKNGACAECMGSPTVISGKFPTALAEVEQVLVLDIVVAMMSMTLYHLLVTAYRGAEQ